MTTKKQSPRMHRRVLPAGVLGLASVVFAAVTLTAGTQSAHAQQGRLPRSGSLPSRLERSDRAVSRPAATPSSTQTNTTTTTRDSRDNRDRDSRDSTNRSSSRDTGRDSRETFSVLGDRLRDRLSERRQDDRSSSSGGGGVTFGGSFRTDSTTPARGSLPQPRGGADDNGPLLNRRDRGMITQNGVTPGGGNFDRFARPQAPIALPPPVVLPPAPRFPDYSAPTRDSRDGRQFGSLGRDSGRGGASAEPRRATLPPSGGGLLPGGMNRGGAISPLGPVTLLPPRSQQAGIAQSVLPRSLPHRTSRRGGATVYRGGNVYYYDYGYGYYDNYSSSYCVPPATGVTVVLPGGGSAYVFNGYGTTYLPGTTFYSPYWYYRSPTFIQRNYLVTAPYPYLYGRELNDGRSSWGDEDRYFGTDTARSKGLRAALNDLARFWEENDARALRRRVSPDFAVGVFQDENYAYSLKRGDFLALSGDALDRVSTISFRFDNVRDRTDGLVNAYATHVFRVRGEQEAQKATVRYTFVYVDGDWYVSAISHTPFVVTE